MCGICGILYCGEERRVQRDTLAQMNAHIVHRGPDDDGFFVEGNVGLAMRRLSITRDRLGIKPLYYFSDDKTFIFGSEIKAIPAYPGKKPESNQSTLAEYLAFGYIARQETMFTGICKLPPGNPLEIDDAGKIKVESYWDLSIPAGNDGRPRAHYIKTYRELLEECVASHLMSDV